MTRTSPPKRTRHVRGSLRMRLLLTFGLGSIVLFLLIRFISFMGIPWLNFAGERDMFISVAEQNLQAIADEKKDTLQQWFIERLGDGRVVSNFPGFRAHAGSLARIVRQHGTVSGGRMRILLSSNEPYRYVLERMHIVVRNYAQYDGIELVDLASGLRMVSTDEGSVGSIAPYAKELQGENFAGTNEKLFFGVEEGRTKAFLYMAFPVKAADDRPHAALVFRIESSTFLLRLFHESSVFGATGEIILVDMRKTLLTPLKYKLPDGSDALPLSYVLQTKPAEVASLGVEALFSSRDYRGVPILAAVRHARITHDFGIGLIVKRDESEIYEPARRSLLITGGVTALGLFILMGLVAVAARAIARPIESLNEAAEKIASGDLGARTSVGGHDEVAALAHTFNDMAERMEAAHRTLERRVEERTGELTAANQLLRVEIAERRQVARTLRESEARFRQLAENIPEVFWIGSVDWQKIYYISPAYETIWGRRCADLYARPTDWFNAVIDEDRDAIAASIPKSVTAGVPVSFPDYRIKRPDGSIRWISARAFPVAEEDGTVSRIVGIAEDISERKNLENQLIQAQKMESVGRLAGGVAHDFNNMLAIIFIALELARMNLAENDPVREQLSDIEKAAAHSRDITRQLLAFSRKQLISPRCCNLNAIIAALEKSLGRLIGEDVELRFYPDPELGSVSIDPSQMDQILVNLAVNARDALPHGGKLTIATENVSFDEDYSAEHPDVRPGRYVMLSVSDDGTGMDSETLTHIFEPFFTTKEVGKGTGLGLAMIYGIVKQNNGFINVYSEVGQGTSFKLYFPRQDEEIPLRAEQESAPLEKAEGSVLLVEDDELLCRVTTATLQMFGYTVTAVHSPREALNLFERECPNFSLLLTDVVMPGMNGRELAERIAEKCPGLRALYMSGYTEDAVIHRGVLEEGMHFLQKPFSVKELAGKIREVMEM